MVVHIGQMSQGLQMTTADTPKFEESTESFESVLVNAGKEKLQSEKTLGEKGNCAEDSISEKVKADDTTASQNADAAMVAGTVVAQQIMLQPTVEIVDANASVNSMVGIAPVESVDGFNAENAKANPVQFAEVETIVSNFAEQDTEVVQIAESVEMITESLEQVTSVETDLPEILADTTAINQGKNQVSTHLVANDKSLLTNAENTVEGLQNSQVAPTEDSVPVETYELTENLVSEHSSQQPDLDAETIEVLDEFAGTATNIQSIDSTSGTAEMRVGTREMFVSVREQVITQITRNLENVSLFRNEISFVLNPENLGEVSIKMAVENGVLTVELSSANKETQSILAANLESIREVLKNLGTDDQVNNIAQETHPDYLQQHSEQNGGNNHHAQEENSAEPSIDDTQFTENFLTMLDMFGSEDI